MDVVYQLINFSTTNGLEFVAIDNITKNTYSKWYVLLTCVFNYDARILQGVRIAYPIRMGYGYASDTYPGCTKNFGYVLSWIPVSDMFGLIGYGHMAQLTSRLPRVTD